MSEANLTPHDEAILQIIRDSGLTFPWLDDQAILDQVSPIAQEWILMQLVTKHLSQEDQELYRDAYITAPDVFDTFEFLDEKIPQIEYKIDTYFEEWSQKFRTDLQSTLA